MVDVRTQRADGSKVRDRRIVEGPQSRAQAWGDKRQAVLLGELHAPSPPELEPEPTRVLTVAEWAPTMTRYYQGRKYSSVDNAQTLIRTHIVPQIGHLPLDRVTDSVKDELEATWRRGGYLEVNRRGTRQIKPTASKKTINNRKQVLLSVLKYALSCSDESGLKSMPCTIKLAKVDVQRAPKFYEVDVYGQLVAAAAKVNDPRAMVVVLLGGDAGLRGGEMVSLRWSDVNMGARRLTVAKATYERTVHDRVEDETKGGKEKPVPMSPRLLKALKKLQPTDHEHVLVNKDGKPLSWRELTGVIMKAERACGMPKRQGLLHVLRHTYVSHLALAGVPAITIKEMARHEHLMTTQKYMHLSKDAKEEGIKALTRLRAR